MGADEQRILLCKTVCSSQEYFISLNFICICTDTVAVLNYAVYLYICVGFETVLFVLKFKTPIFWVLVTVPDMFCEMFDGYFDWSVQHTVVQTVGPHDLLFSRCFYYYGTYLRSFCLYIYMCVKINLPYYSVTAQFKLTLFPLFVLLLLLCLYPARSLKGFLCVGVCSLAAVKRSSV